MAVPPGTQQDIREMDARGVPRARVSRELGVSRNTVAKYADMSPTAPVSETRPHPAVDAYAAWIDDVLEADLGAPRKQRHTAKRIFDRLVDERGYEGSYASACRYVARWREDNAPASPRDGYLELERAPGTAQVDFGNFRCEAAGAARDLKLLVLDELGYVPLDIEGARLLFQVMSADEGTQSMIITTNIEFSKWGTVFGDDKMASAVVDRLVYTGRLVEFNGASYRMENALMLGKGREV